MLECANIPRRTLRSDSPNKNRLGSCSMSFLCPLRGYWAERSPTWRVAGASFVVPMAASTLVRSERSVRRTALSIGSVLSAPSGDGPVRPTRSVESIERLVDDEQAHGVHGAGEAGCRLRSLETRRSAAAALYALPNDELDCARKVAWLLVHPEERARMGRVGQRRVAQAFEHSVPELLRAHRDGLGLSVRRERTSIGETTSRPCTRIWR
jgi:hypothetical protein